MNIYTDLPQSYCTLYPLNFWRGGFRAFPEELDNDPNRILGLIPVSFGHPCPLDTRETWNDLLDKQTYSNTIPDYLIYENNEWSPITSKHLSYYEGWNESKKGWNPITDLQEGQVVPYWQNFLIDSNKFLDDDYIQFLWETMGKRPANSTVFTMDDIKPDHDKEAEATKHKVMFLEKLEKNENLNDVIIQFCFAAMVSFGNGSDWIDNIILQVGELKDDEIYVGHFDDRRFHGDEPYIINSAGRAFNSVFNATTEWKQEYIENIGAIMHDRFDEKLKKRRAETHVKG